MGRKIEYRTFIYEEGGHGSLRTTEVVVGVDQCLVPNEELLARIREWPGYNDPYMRKELRTLVKMVVDRVTIE